MAEEKPTTKDLSEASWAMNLTYGTRETYHLVGGFRCRLTLDEVNNWDEYIVVHPVYEQWEDEWARYHAVRGQARFFTTPEDHTRHVIHARHGCIEAMKQCRAVAKAWYAVVLKARGYEVALRARERAEKAKDAPAEEPAK